MVVISSAQYDLIVTGLVGKAGCPRKFIQVQEQDLVVNSDFEDPLEYSGSGEGGGGGGG